MKYEEYSWGLKYTFCYRMFWKVQQIPHAQEEISYMPLNTIAESQQVVGIRVTCMRDRAAWTWLDFWVLGLCNSKLSAPTIHSFLLLDSVFQLKDLTPSIRSKFASLEGMDLGHVGEGVSAILSCKPSNLPFQVTDPHLATAINSPPVWGSPYSSGSQEFAKVELGKKFMGDFLWDARWVSSMLLNSEWQWRR